ncbi:MAG: YggT family protein [Andreesenia angusta]|nr:YggT family protein [Andreesenia angusta]
MNAFFRALYMFSEILIWAILIRSFLFMVTRNINNPIVKALFIFTEPILQPTRNLMARLNLNTGMLDFSPLIAIILINIIRGIIFKMVI